MSLKLELCDKKDIDIVYELSNDYETRKNSFNDKFILYEDHCKWYESSLKNKSRIMCIFKNDDIVIGMMRLDIEGSKAVVSYNIKKEFRGNGYGNELLSIIKNYIFNKKEIVQLEGLVKKNNIASRKAFIKNNFVEYEEEKCYRYIFKLKAGI